MTEETNRKRAAQCFASLRQAVDELKWNVHPWIMGMNMMVDGIDDPEADYDVYYEKCVEFGIAFHPEREDFTIGAVLIDFLKGTRRMEYLMAMAVANEGLSVGEYLYRPASRIGAGPNDGVLLYFLRQNIWDIPGTVTYFKELLRGLYDQILPTKRRFIKLKENEILLEDFIREEREKVE